MRTWAAAVVLALCGGGVLADAAPAAQPAARSPEVDAIAVELKRGVGGLRLEDSPAPYLAEARTVRAEVLALDGSYGGVITNVHDRQAIGTVEVRVGDLERDNSNFFGAQSGIARVDVPIEPAPGYLRKKLWLALDRAFRGATKAYAQKQTTLERLATDEQPPDFSAGPGRVRHLVEPDPVEIDRDGLASMVASLSARYRDWPSIDNGDVHLQVMRSHESVVTSDGVALQFVHDRAVLAIVADTKAADGMHLDHGLAIHLQSVPDADEALLERGEKLVDQVLRELDELTRAPMIEEEYDGPILFAGSAAAQILAATVATEASGVPPPLGDGGRMMELEPAWQDRLGKQVMPPFVDLIDDPTAQGFGHFTRDAEGFAPKALSLVRAGTLENLLMTRTPNEYVSGSNGRARMAPALAQGPAISNLELRSHKRGLSLKALERDLLARAREDGYEFAYVIESLRNGGVLGPVPRESAAAYAGTGKIDLPLPARVYRLDADGKRTLVRGAVLAPASIRVLRRIRAVGRRPHTESLRIPPGGYGGFSADVGIDGLLSETVDVQITTPDLLIEGFELLVERGEHERLPTLVHPLRRQDDTPAVSGD